MFPEGRQGSHVTCLVPPHVFFFIFFFKMLKFKYNPTSVFDKVFKSSLLQKITPDLPVMHLREEATNVTPQIFIFTTQSCRSQRPGSWLCSPAVSNNLCTAGGLRYKQSAAPLVLFYFYFVSCVGFSLAFICSRRNECGVLFDPAESQREKAVRETKKRFSVIGKAHTSTQK